VKATCMIAAVLWSVGGTGEGGFTNSKSSRAPRSKTT